MQFRRFPNAPAGLLFASDPGCPTGIYYSSLADFAPSALPIALPLTAKPAFAYVPGSSSENNVQQQRTRPNFGPIGMIDSGFNSNYNSLQLSVEKRLSYGLSFLADYTWSRAFNDFSQSLNAGSYYQTNPFNRNFNYGPASSDLPDVIQFSGTWEIPHLGLGGAAEKILNGWALAPILTWQSGYPFSVMCGCDNSFSGDYVDRADFIGTNFNQAKLNPNRPHDQWVQEYFNTAVFAPNAIGTFGNSGKNNLRGPGMFDLALCAQTDVLNSDEDEFRRAAIRQAEGG